MRSWEEIFENAGWMQFTITGVAVTVEGDCAWVVCTENMSSVQVGLVSDGRIQATNTFECGTGRWLMVHHYGSPLVEWAVITA